MSKNEIITFILVGKKEDQLEKELLDLDSVIDHGNAIIMRGTTKFKMLYDNMKEDFQFRLIIHYGLKIDSNSVGKRISTGLKSDYNFQLEFFTRETAIFNETNQLYTMYSTDNSKNKVRMYNFDEMNTDHFINQLPVFCKRDTLKSNIENVESDITKTKIFIGSSTDGLKYAEAIKKVLEGQKLNYDVDIWDDVFGKENLTNIELLEKTVDQYKFSIFIFSPDDTIRMSNAADLKKMPRDNVIFEYGLFMGKNGRPNTFFIAPSNRKDLHILSDIDGLICMSYEDNANKVSAVRSLCTTISEAIQKLQNFKL
jgi:predicted nucleotide-binding protein